MKLDGLKWKVIPTITYYCERLYNGNGVVVAMIKQTPNSTFFRVYLYKGFMQHYFGQFKTIEQAKTAVMERA